MTFYYTVFNGVNLPVGIPSDTVNLIARPNIQPMKEGAINLDASTRVRHQGMPIQHSGLLSGKSSLESTADALRVIYGFEGRLERKRINSRDTHWTGAMLNSINSTVTLENTNRLQVAMSFTQLSPVWYGLTEQIVTDALITDGQSVTVRNNGNATITNPVLTLTLPSNLSVTFTNINIAITGRVNITFVGTFVADDVLIFDAGSLKFTQNGVFPGSLSLIRSSTLHKTRAWIDFEPGDNVLIFSATPAIPTLTDILSGMYAGSLSSAGYSKDFLALSGGIIVNISFFDGWE